MKGVAAFRSWVTILVVCLLATSAWADSLQLKDGRLIHGKYLGGTEESVNFQVDGQVERYPVTDILVLEFGNRGPAATPTAPATPSPQAKAAVASASSAESLGTSEVPKAAARSETITVPEGTRLTVRMIDSVNSDTNRVGDRFMASLDEDLLTNGKVVVSKGADVYGRLIEAKGAGRIRGQSELRLELTGIMIQEKIVPIVTSDYEVSGKSRGTNTAEKVGGGAALGAIIGAIAGGGKGAAIGAGVGAGAGTAIQVITHGEQVHIPSETVLEFTLAQPVRVPVA
jgi:hypothetical protein